MWFMIAAAVLSMVAAAQQASAQRAAGQAAKQAAEYEATLAGRRADQMEIRSGQERAETARLANEQRAASQRDAIDQRRQGNLVASRARALAAASGGGVNDPTVTGILGDIDTEAEYRALTARYRGESAATRTEFEGDQLTRALDYGAVLERAGAEGTRYAGEVERRLANAKADQAIVSGLSNAASAGATYSFYRGGGTGTIAGGTSPLYAKYAAPYQDYR
jgi:hypothetical protein